VTAWRRPRKRVRLDLTSLIDVVFMLLLFLVVASHFDQRSALPVGLPHDARAVPAAQDPLVVSVTASGITVAGTMVADAGPEAARRLAAKPGASVVLEAEAAVPYERVFAVLASLSKAGIADVGLAYEVRP
jgi:biopolymer transport protein ExbD